MSSAAHRFGCVKFWVLNICFDFFTTPACRNNNQYSIFKIRHVQIDELPRTLVFLNSNFAPFWISPCNVRSPSGPLDKLQVECSVQISPYRKYRKSHFFSQYVSTKILFFYFPLWNIAKILNTSTYGNAMIIPLPRETPISHPLHMVSQKILT